MAVQANFTEEKNKLKQYLKSDSNEDAKRPLIYPLFHKLYKDKFKIESDAHGADVYIEGQIIVECKTSYADWLDGFYQALHYHKKHGLVYSIVMVIAEKFVGIWRVNQLTEYAVLLSHTADANKAPNVIGKENARKTTQANKKQIQESAIYWLEPKDLSGDFFKGEGKSIDYELHEILNILKNPAIERLQMNTRNFIEHIELLKKFFDNPLDAVHCFYSIVAYWDITSVVSTNEYSDKIRIVGFKGQKHSDEVSIKPSLFKNFKKFVESRFIFTNEGSGLTVDYYFSRFDEVMARIDPEYVKQHGIFFTDINLSKFALWFAKDKMSEQLDERYVWFDPAGGSGNLISSWRGKLKHKIISELQPDLLRIIERRMRIDPWHVETGFTIIPKTSENKGLNFLDCGAKEYVTELEKELKLKNLFIDKPLAFLLNPPYKNTDENETVRESADSNYRINKDILKITGEDAGKERYLAFLGQILNIAKYQNEQNPDFEPLVLIFTPTSWLIPRPTYVNFRIIWDTHFEYTDGFIITSNEFFKLQGKWPLAFTIWRYKPDEKRENHVKAYDFTSIKHDDLNINWSLGDEELKLLINNILKNQQIIKLDNSRGEIKESLPAILHRNGKYIRQTRFDFSHAKKNEDDKTIISGFPLNDKTRHFELSRVCGNLNGEFIGFMDDNTPVRLKQESLSRLTNKPDRIWFRLDNDFKGTNKSKIFNGPSDNRGYCAYDIESSKATFSWFVITKALNGIYPIWANQFDIWIPDIKPEQEKYWHSLCFAFVLAENRCVVTKFEKDNPVQGAPEVFVDNPLCPANPDAFWATTLDKEVLKEHGLAFALVNKIKELYKTWNVNYCKGQYLQNVGLENEPYFKYFDYDDFLTPYSGLIQIRKYAEINSCSDLLDLFTEIQALTKKVKEEIYRLLVVEFKYFE
ncbi:MAG: hypothetical protein U0W24_20505 [Bacteroidales bacterium]